MVLQQFTSTGLLRDMKLLSSSTSGDCVYSAKSNLTHDPVMVKKIVLQNRKPDGLIASALREIYLNQISNHENIVKVLQIDTDKRYATIIMESGVSDMFSYIRDSRLTTNLTTFKNILRDVLNGLSYLHARGIIHRDLKPSNLIRMTSGQIKIIDFGLSSINCLMPGERTPQMVTLPYRAPEILAGGQIYTGAVDMWSLGCIAVELLTKETLFFEETEMLTLQLIYARLGLPNESTCTTRVNRLRSRIPGATNQMLDFIARLLAFSPKERLTATEALEHPFLKRKFVPRNTIIETVDQPQPSLCDRVVFPCHGNRNSPNAPSKPNGHQRSIVLDWLDGLCFLCANMDIQIATVLYAHTVSLLDRYIAQCRHAVSPTNYQQIAAACVFVVSKVVLLHSLPRNFFTHYTADALHDTEVDILRVIGKKIICCNLLDQIRECASYRTFPVAEKDLCVHLGILALQSSQLQNVSSETITGVIMWIVHSMSNTTHTEAVYCANVLSALRASLSASTAAESATKHGDDRKCEDGIVMKTRPSALLLKRLLECPAFQQCKKRCRSSSFTRERKRVVKV